MAVLPRGSAPNFCSRGGTARFDFAATTMNKLLTATLWCFLVACSGAKPRVEIARPAPAPAAIERLAAGSTLVVARPTPGVARMSLWIDAGSRDGVPTQLAAASAYWAEQHSGASARVLPDGTELSLLCDTRTRGVEVCVEQLARAFVLPIPSAAEAERLRARLRQGRARAAADSTHEADELAFSALFGEQAASLFPFGREADDGRIDGPAVQRFAADFYQPARALLIAAGDVNEGDVARAFAKATSRARGVAKPRATDPLSSRSAVRVGSGNQGWLSFALACPSSEAAAAVGFRIQRLYPQASARVSNVRGRGFCTCVCRPGTALRDGCSARCLRPA